MYTLQIGTVDNLSTIFGSLSDVGKAFWWVYFLFENVLFAPVKTGIIIHRQVRDEKNKAPANQT